MDDNDNREMNIEELDAMRAVIDDARGKEPFEIIPLILE